MSGIWFNIRKKDLKIKRIIGGITNEMFYCSLTQQINSNNSEPKEVAIKLYRRCQRPLDANDSIMNDIIVGLIVSENSLGPKIYGISTDAVIMQFIQVCIFRSYLIRFSLIYFSVKKCHQFSARDQKNPSLVIELGQKLAKIHSLKPPINRTINWFFVTFTEKHINSYKTDSINDLIKENELKYFIENDFEIEFKFLKKLVLKIDSPIVFSHNDFGFNNILVKDYDETKYTNDRIVLSDFEFSSYCFRGRDFGIVFDDWLNFNQLSYEKSHESIIEPFLESYYFENVKIHGNSYAEEEKNSVKHLLIESKIFLLLQKMFSIVYHLNVNESVLKTNKLKLMVMKSQFSYILTNFLFVYFSTTDKCKRIIWKIPQFEK
jgi:thiamine kinase-like enzyme